MPLRIENQLTRLCFLRNEVRHAVIPAKFILPKKDEHLFVVMVPEIGRDFFRCELFGK